MSLSARIRATYRLWRAGRALRRATDAMAAGRKRQCRDWLLRAGRHLDANRRAIG